MKWIAKLDRTTLAIGSLVMAAVILLSVNVIAANVFRQVKADLTEDNVFTIAQGTREVVKGIEEPVDLRVYYSKQLGEQAPSYARYFDRIRALLEQYRDISGGRLRVSFLNPEPFSDTEDRAVAAGLKGVRLNQEGDRGYFGLVGTNSTDDQKVIEFFSPDRERFIEYDITKLVHNLANPEKPSIGLISGLEVGGQVTPQGRRQQAWMVMQQIRETYKLHKLDQDIGKIPDLVDTLMVIHPDKLTGQAAYAIDQFVLRGGRVLAFVDPFSETGAGRRMPQRGEKEYAFDKLLANWGVEFDRSKIAGDRAHARRVQFNTGSRPVVTEHVVWLGLDESSVEKTDVLSGGIETLNLASAGFFKKRGGAETQVQPILRTSEESMAIEADKVRFSRDPVGLLRQFEPSGERLTLAARITGPVKSAFPDGQPKAPEDGKKDKSGPGRVQPGAAAKKNESEAVEPGPHVGKGKVNAIVVGDADMLHDQFWVETNSMFGQNVAIPRAHNATFVLNALDNLTGSSSLISLRGRGVEDRPFHLVEKLRRDAERRYREKEEALVARLEKVRKKLQSVESQGGGGDAILTREDQETIDKFRRDMIETRRQLREVKHALRKDIDRLDTALKFANIAGVPLLIGIGGIAVAVTRHRRKVKRKTGDG